jgi:hypothetical protein
MKAKSVPIATIEPSTTIGNSAPITAAQMP